MFEKLEPFGAGWENLLAAMLASLIANSNRDPKKTDPFTLDDFMVIGKKEDAKEKLSPLQQLKQHTG